MIFFKKDPVLGVDLESAINNAVFPGLQVVRLCSCSITMNDFTWLYHSSLILYSKANLTLVNHFYRVVLITTQLGDLRSAWSLCILQNLGLNCQKHVFFPIYFYMDRWTIERTLSNNCSCNDFGNIMTLGFIYHCWFWEYNELNV